MVFKRNWTYVKRVEKQRVALNPVYGLLSKAHIMRVRVKLSKGLFEISWRYLKNRFQLIKRFNIIELKMYPFCISSF